MNGLIRIIASVGAGVLILKVLQQRPIKNYLLGALVDGVYYLIKKKLRS